MDEVVRAARAACLDEFLRDPIGLDSAVGEGGEGVSGGQRCRIALARALVMNPMVLVVDEFSSQLDDELERRIIDRISGSRPNGFSVFITHSRVVAAAADRVLPLRDGRVFNEAAWI
jgi:ABC-type bacteriocin/lantibiotic exporter with double-glycine peptidase domain